MSCVCFQTGLRGPGNMLGGMSLVSYEKWSDKFSVIMLQDHEECREEIYSHGQA